jgi:hypothetical protein
LNGFEKESANVSKREGRNKRYPAFLVDVSGVDFAGMHAEGRLSKLTANQLKSFLFDNDVSYTGAKAVLIDRVSEYLTSRPKEPSV